MNPQPVVVFLHSGDYDRVHQGLSIAASAVSMGRPAHVFFFWWALERLATGNLDEPDFGPGREPFASRFEQHGLPTLRYLLEYLKSSNLCALHACTSSTTLLSSQMPGIEKWIERFDGWSSILQLTQGMTDRFYL